MKYFKTLKVGLSIAAVVLFLQGCKTTEKQMYDSIHIGMHRAEVEKILGKPFVEIGDRVYYGKAPERPISLTTIVVKYAADSRVASKEFYDKER